MKFCCQRTNKWTFSSQGFGGSRIAEKMLWICVTCSRDIKRKEKDHLTAAKAWALGALSTNGAIHTQQDKSIKLLKIPDQGFCVVLPFIAKSAKI